MTSGKTIIYIVMSAVGVSLIPAAALAVPVVPNFSQGSMTSHTETTSKVTETINSIDYATGWQYSVSGTNVTNGGQSLSPNPTTNSVIVNPLGGTEGQVTSANSGLNLNGQSFTIAEPGAAFQFTQTYMGPGCNESNCDSKNNRGYQRERYNFHFYAVNGTKKSITGIMLLCILSPSIARAADVGGVSATANPIANSVLVQLQTKLFRSYRVLTSLTSMVVVSHVKDRLLISHRSSLMLVMRRIHLKDTTWNLNMMEEILKVS